MASYQPKMDEVFDDDVEEDQIVQKEWNRTEKDIKKTGYRLGLSAGQEETLQQGFDSGYARAAEASRLLGKVRGDISAHLQILESATGPGVGGQCETLVAHLRDLLDQCTRFEQSYMLQVMKWQLSGVPVSAVTVDQPTQGPASPLQVASVDTDAVVGHGTPSPTAARVGGVGEVSDLLSAMRVQESPPVSLAAFLQHVQGSMLQIVLFQTA